MRTRNNQEKLIDKQQKSLDINLIEVIQDLLIEVKDLKEEMHDTMEQLIDLNSQMINNHHTEIVNNSNTKINEEVFLTRKETAALLSISVRTLDRWRVSKTIDVYAIKGRRYFKRTEIESVMTKVGGEYKYCA